RDLIVTGVQTCALPISTPPTPATPAVRPAGGPAARPGRSVYVELGRGELRAGRRLDALQMAYRLGARISWRRLAGVARGAGVDPDRKSVGEGKREGARS